MSETLSPVLPKSAFCLRPHYDVNQQQSVLHNLILVGRIDAVLPKPSSVSEAMFYRCNSKLYSQALGVGGQSGVDSCWQRFLPPP